MMDCHVEPFDFAHDRLVETSLDVLPSKRIQRFLHFGRNDRRLKCER